MPTLTLAPSRRANRAEMLDTEYLVANDLGGYSMGTADGARTRQYHGFLVAALAPPIQRTVLIAQVDITAEIAGERFPLSTHLYLGGTVSPSGDSRLRDFSLIDGLPCWTHDLDAGRSLVQTHLMPHGENTAILEARYDAPPDAPPATLRFAPLCTYRDYHGRTIADYGRWLWEVEANGDARRVSAFRGAAPYYLAAFGADGSPATFTQIGNWYYRFSLPAEVARGFGDGEDAWQVGEFAVTVAPGETVRFVAAMESEHTTAAHLVAAVTGERARRAGIATPRPEDGAYTQTLAHLRLAADAFVVRRGFTADAGATVIAGYPWFSDWGRDTMIALPGLCLATGRYAEAAEILHTFARYVSEGMLPNRFPDDGEDAEYNTADATLWFFRALEEYLRATGDYALLVALWPTLTEIITAHQHGTRYGIHVDPTDFLLTAGEEGVQLTWMDAKLGDWVVTPRRGKPVEINGLWLHALCLMAAWAPECDADAAPYTMAATRTATSFVRRFWDAERGYLKDVVDTPDGTDDRSLRPNQCIALALSTCPIPKDDARRAFTAVTTHLLTPYGLRSLAPGEAQYEGRYHGNPTQRDGAYHQGTVWAWLIGPYVDTLLRLGGKKAEARALLRPLMDTLRVAGLGSLSEVFDGDAPHIPGGCPFQAWSVAELLRLLPIVAAKYERGKDMQNGKRIED